MILSSVMAEAGIVTISAPQAKQNHSINTENIHHSLNIGEEKVNVFFRKGRKKMLKNQSLHPNSNPIKDDASNELS